MGHKCIIFKIQDGGRRHLGFTKIWIISARMKQFLLNFTSVHLAPTAVDPIGKKAQCSKSKMAAAAIMDIKKCQQFPQGWSNSHQRFTLYRVRLVPACIDPLCQMCTFKKKVQDDDGRHLGYRKLSIISTRMKLFSPNFNSVHLVQTNFITFGQKCIVSLSIVYATA